MCKKKQAVTALSLIVADNCSLWRGGGELINQMRACEYCNTKFLPISPMVI